MAPAHSKHKTEKEKKKAKKTVEKGEPVAKPSKAEKVRKGKEIVDAARKSALRTQAASTAPATRVNIKSKPTFVYCTPPDKSTGSLKSPSEASVPVPVQAGKKVDKPKDHKKEPQEVKGKKDKKTEKPAKPEKKTRAEKEAKDSQEKPKKKSEGKKKTEKEEDLTQALALAIPVQKKAKPVESKSEASDAETSKKRKHEDDEFQKCLDELDVSDAEEEGEEEPEEETGQGAEVSDGETTLELPGPCSEREDLSSDSSSSDDDDGDEEQDDEEDEDEEDGEEAEQEDAGQEDAGGAHSTALVAVEGENDEKGKAITAAAQQGVMVAQKANST